MMRSMVCVLPLVSSPPCSVARSDLQIHNGQRHGLGMLCTALMQQYISMHETTVWLGRHIFRSSKHTVSDQSFPSYAWQISALVQPFWVPQRWDNAIHSFHGFGALVRPLIKMGHQWMNVRFDSTYFNMRHFNSLNSQSCTLASSESSI